MSRGPLLGACGVAVLCAAASIALLGGGRVGSTWALFNAETRNGGSAFAAGWVAAATPSAPTPSGADVDLSWTPGVQGVASQQLYVADNNTSPDCSSASYTALGSALAATAGSATDAGRGSAASGHYVCYRIESRNSSWTATAAFPAVRAGFVATAVSISDGDGQLAAGDAFSVTFNQPPATPTATRLCTFASPTNVILVGDVPGNCSSSSDAAVIRFGLSSGSLAKNNTTYAVSWSASGNTLTATVTSAPSGNKKTTSSGAAFTFAPGSVVSAAGSSSPCTSSPSCTPTPTGGF